jgi:hypothetical protein
LGELSRGTQERNARSSGLATATQKRRVTSRAARALKLLASNLRGVTDGAVLAHGFTPTMMAGLVRDGLATVQRETLKVGGAPMRFESYHITAAGWKTLKGR